ncbi:uncharacterized protein cubi_00852 [Cryptosporidium ubiquitum]|uniref:Uncharacterized protein n=1 Tax=Cryptosporidium ubiquitum TaxID=857276 RepID=A0A1J4MF70_9CRYT|nr:uncharacterized protein cubi_00852 [Cryptosporidium ubiquitum]OII72880.1 hypothetical protein cubi_00852 [Cryptosporidium ubiquitum]
MENSGLEAVAERIRNGKNDGVEFLFLTKPVEGCLISQEILSELLDFDIFCIDWKEFNKDPKYTVGNFEKVNSINFIIQEPLILVLREVFTTLEATMDANLELKTRIYLPYSSELHVEYAKNVGVLQEEMCIGGKNVIIKKFDFESILNEIRRGFEGLNISIETVNWISIFYSNASLICDNSSSSVYATCVEDKNVSIPILEEDLERIYNIVMSERKNKTLNNYVMPTLFSKENVKDMTLLKLDNLPVKLRRAYSRQVLQLMAFIQQVTEISFLESESSLINFLSIGPTSNIISKVMQDSYLEIIRAGSKTQIHPDEPKKNHVTLLIMDRSLDCISPIYSPILNMNLSEDETFTRFDDGIAEFLDEFILNNTQYKVENEFNVSDRPGKEDGELSCQEEKTPYLLNNKVGELSNEQELNSSNNFEEGCIHEVTNPVYLSIMLDPEKLQKDLIISQNYPILSYRFISALEDLQGLISSKERNFSGCLKKDIINRIDSIMNIFPLFGHHSWMFLLLTLKQSQYTRKFWNDVSEVCNNYEEKPNKKKTMVLSIIYRYLVIIQNHISLSSNDLNMKSPSTQTSSSSLSPIIYQDQVENEEEIIGKLVSILLVIREKLLPDSITNISKKLEDLSLNPLLYNTYDLPLELSALLQILHYFIIPMFPLDLVSFNSIFVRNLRKKFTNSSFENISVNDQNDLQIYSLECIRKIISLAISCSSYEGPDCKLTSFNLRQMLDHFHSEKLHSFGDLGRLEQKLNSIRNARSLLKYKSFRNFQLSAFLPENINKKQELQELSLVAQVSFYILQTIFIEESNVSKNWLKVDLKMESVSSTYKESDLQSLRNRLKETKKTLIINIIGNISMFEINEIERLSKKYQEYVKIIILTDHISSAVSITNSLITNEL